MIVSITVDASEEEKRWNIFTKVIADMHSLKLTHFFLEHAVTIVIHDKVTHVSMFQCN